MLLAKRVPWVRAYMIAQWLYRHGSDRLKKNLDENERRELWALTLRSKGQKSNLTPKEQQRYIDLVRQGARGRRR